MAAKVIDIHTREEITQLPYSIENAKDIIDYLMRYSNPRTKDPVTEEEYKIIDSLLHILENNSGVLRKEVLKQGA